LKTLSTLDLHDASRFTIPARSVLRIATVWAPRRWIPSPDFEGVDAVNVIRMVLVLSEGTFRENVEDTSVFGSGSLALWVEKLAVAGACPGSSLDFASLAIF
jgi:hypothetical protein